MKKINWLKTTVGVSLLLSVAIGCSKWNQDPLADRPKHQNDGQGKPTEPIIPKPISSEAILIDAPDFQGFQEEREDEMQLSARVLIEGYQVEMTIENLQLLPGATYDSATGTLKWKPSRGTVTGADGYRDFALNLKAVATKANSPVLVRERVVRLSVNRLFGIPEVVTVNTNSNSIREEEQMQISVRIRDLDATTDEQTWPTLALNPTIGRDNILNLLTVSRRTSIGSGQFEFLIVVDTRGVEFTKNVSIGGFSVVPVSQFQRRGVARDVSLSIFTSFAKPVSTYGNGLDVTVGESVQYSFLIMDPKNELKLQVVRFVGVPAGATAICTPASESVAACTFKWPKVDSGVGSLSFRAEIQTNNASTSDIKVERPVLDFIIRVAAAPTPTPTPTPIKRGGR